MNATENDTEPAKFLSFEDLPKRVPYSSRQLRTLIRTGVIPVIKIPGHRKLLFDWSAVTASLRKHSSGKTTV